MKRNSSKTTDNTARRRAGFTLVELVVVIAVLAILAGVGAVAYRGYIKKAQEAADLEKLNAIKTAACAFMEENGDFCSRIDINPRYYDNQPFISVFVYNEDGTKCDVFRVKKADGKENNVGSGDVKLNYDRDVFYEYLEGNSFEFIAEKFKGETKTIRWTSQTNKWVVPK